MLSSVKENNRKLVTFKPYDNLGKYKINADYLKFYAREECYRELMVSYYPMLPLLEHTVPFKEADYILYMHMYARCEEYSEFVVKQLKYIAKTRKKGAEIIVVGKAANAEKILNGSISNITFWGDHFTEKLGKKFGINICENYFVYDDHARHLAIWPVNGCLNKCKFCRRSYMDIKFESLSLETIKIYLDFIQLTSPEQMKKISLRAENITEYGIDIYGKPMLHELIKLVESYREVVEIEIKIGLCIGEITDEILESICNSKKITNIYMNIETGSERLLKLIGKKHSCNQVRYIFSKIHELNPRINIFTTIMIGLPTEDMGDILDTAKLILEVRPYYIHCNYFICSQNSPLAKYPKLSHKCREYHLKSLIHYLRKLKVNSKYEFEMDCWYVRKKYSRADIKEMEDLEKMNIKRIKRGLLPRHIDMDCKFILGKNNNQ